MSRLTRFVMRVKRTAILASLLVSMVASLWFGSMAVLDSESPDTVYADGQAPNAVAPPALANDPETNRNVETRSGSITGYVLWVAALVAASVFMVSMVLFRGEVRTEKQAARIRRQRQAYHRDLRRYKEQMKGPPRDNT